MGITYRRGANGDFYAIVKGEDRTETFEVAAWYRVLSLSDGEYRMFGVDRYGKPRSNEDVVRYKALIPATIFDSYFPSLFGGCQRCSDEQRGRDAAEVGNPYQYVLSIDAEWLYQQVALPDELATSEAWRRPLRARLPDHRAVGYRYATVAGAVVSRK